MFVGKRLAGDSTYSEINTIDFERGVFMCSNTGEGDFSNASDPKAVNIFPAASFTGKAQRGCIGYDPLALQDVYSAPQEATRADSSDDR